MKAAFGKSRVAELPRFSELLARWFTWYSRRFMRRQFHSFRVAGRVPRNISGPLVIFSNHASWWDPIVATLVRDAFFPGRKMYAPVDARALEKYSFFKRLGFFPVEPDSARGALQLLRVSEAVLNEPDSILWITPQGHFADVRQRPLRFKAGLGHLAARLGGARFLPVAIEYVFWEERLPEALVQFGQTIPVERPGAGGFDAETWTRMFERELEQTQEALAQAAIRRDPAEFRHVLSGRAGVGGVYDVWRQFRAGLRGRRFRLEHGTK